MAATAARARVSLACGCGVTGLEGCLAWPLQALCISVPSTILVEPGCQAEVTETGDIRVSVGAEAPSTVGAQLDPIHLSIFSHRFMSIAGEWRHCPPGPSVRCQVWGLPAGRRWAQVVRLAGLCRENVSRRGRGGSGVLAGGLALEWHGPLPQGSALPPAARAWHCLWTGRGLSTVNLSVQRQGPSLLPCSAGCRADVGPQVLVRAPGAGDAPHSGQTRPGPQPHCVQVGHCPLRVLAAGLGGLEGQGSCFSYPEPCCGCCGASSVWSLCAPRADGPNPAAHGHLHQHQGAPGLLLRPLWP